MTSLYASTTTNTLSLTASVTSLLADVQTLQGINYGGGISGLQTSINSLQISLDALSESVVKYIYLDPTNGITIKASNAAVVGQSYTLSGTSYKVVDDSTITAEIAAGNYNLVTTGVTSMASMFNGKNSFNTDISFWDTSSVSNTYRMFRGASSFNKNIGAWDVSKVTNMDQMFVNASAFNNGGSSDINNWNTSSVTTFNSAFQNSAFNQNIGSWNVSSATIMSSMFYSNEAFNQDIGSWNVSSATNMNTMFYQAEGFNQDLSGWCIQSNFSSEPTNFKTLANSTWTSDNAKQPDWDGADGSAANCS